MNLTILRVFLNIGILNLEETNLTDPLVHAPKTNLTLNDLGPNDITPGCTDYTPKKEIFLK